MQDGITIKLDLSGLPQLSDLLSDMASRMINPRPVLDAIAAHGEESTRQRFEYQRGPDGNRWKQSLRAKNKGGKTLIESGDLESSIVSDATDDEAIWGVSRVNKTDKYALIHQFGGTIKPVTAKALKFNIPGIGWRTAQSVTIVPRPYMGIDEDDQSVIYDLLANYLMGAA